MSAPDNATELGPKLAELLDGYRPAPGTYDELLAPDGTVRPAWRPVFERLAGMSAEDRTNLQLTAERLFRENGVTFVAQDDVKSTNRPWRLDPFPMLISPDEWAQLEAGLSQRAQILDRTLADLYGPMRLLTDGILPPATVFGNPQFLRACSNAMPRNGPYLHLLAFDLARSPDGSWWVLSDRTEAPSGAGYALENRIVSSHCLPNLFATQNVRRQASFFRSFNEHFLGLAGRDEPLAIFLSRGPAKHTYFEHAYLARYLGYSLVEGSDLTMRDDKIYLKTVEGLQPVDLILRTIRSDMSDPLELRGDSMVGVPGLLQAVRTEHVTVGNAIGSGLVESPAFLSFLPALSRYFLQEDLIIPSVATWWCGQDNERQYVLDNLERLAIRRVSSTRSLLVGGKDGRVNERPSSLADQIRAHGHDFVGQEEVALSTAPVWGSDGRLVPAPVTIRVYVAATADGYKVMPGGLARVSGNSNPHAHWLAAGDISKDTWVLSTEPVETFSLLAQRHDEGHLRRSGRDLPSRAADHMFWLGRYAERAEAAVRLLRSLVIRMSGEMGGHRSLVSPERIAGLLVAQKHLSSRRGKRATEAGRDAVAHELWSILFDRESKDGLATVLGNVRRTADVVRERLSYDTFRILLELSEVPQREVYAGGGRDTDRALRLLNRLTQYLAAFSGMVMENMTRGYGWRFLDMGRRIERIRAIDQLVQHLTIYGDPEQDGGLELLLELADSTMTYRRRYHAAPQLARVLDLLLADATNPRSIVFQLRAVLDHLDVLPHTDDEELLSPDQRIAKRLETDLSLADWHELSEALNRFNARVRLDRRIRLIDTEVNRLSDSITQRFFSHSTLMRLTRGT